MSTADSQGSRSQEELQAPQVASALSVALAITKLTAGFASGSLSLIASGIDSAFDAFTSLLSFILLKMSLEPADKEHPYGHSRIEPVASLGQALFLLLVSVSLGYTACLRFDQKHEVTNGDVALIVSFGCTVVTFILWFYLGKVARRSGSHIIAAERVHYFADLASNIVVFVGFFLARLFPIRNVDAILTLILCVMILSSVYRIANRAIRDLVDQHDPETEEKIAKIIKEFYPQALGTSRTRSRKTGRHSAADIELLTCRQLKFQEVHAISHRVQKRILKEIPSLDIIIHSEPCHQSDCPTDEVCQYKSQGFKL